jgi:hypothetical protein
MHLCGRYDGGRREKHAEANERERYVEEEREEERGRKREANALCLTTIVSGSPLDRAGWLVSRARLF